ncbi:hypothetical protein KC349_g1936 [Hortaea werneckii]|nr:hypothetical protein KC349_g1936 [Hortaea werneckii]
MSPSTAYELARHIAREIGRSWSVAFVPSRQIRLDAPDAWLVGTPLVLTLHHSEMTPSWDELTAALPEAVKRTNAIHSHWKLDEVIHLLAGLDVLQSVRVDRGTGSRVHTPVNSEPYNSLRRLQRVVIRPARPEGARLTSLAVHEDAQLQVPFLRFALRLSPKAIRTVLGFLDGRSWASVKAVTMEEVCSTLGFATFEARLIEVATSALDIAKHAETQTEITRAMSDMNCLASLVSARPELFFLRSQLTGCFGVIFHFDDLSAQTLTRHLAPSYFVDWPGALNRQCLPQVHIPDSRIGSLANCHLVSFYQAPDVPQIEATRDALGRHLGSEHSRALHTAPFKHDASFPTFEIDGSLSRQALDRILSPLVKSALSSCTKGTIRRDVKFESIEQPSRGSVTIVVWARQSDDDTSAATSISRQVWSSLTSGPPVMTRSHPEDRVLIAVEYCSSSSHPWSDRQIRRLLPFDKPLHVVTANPDRLTRRPDEVIPILHEITRTGGSWWTQGLQSHGTRPLQQATSPPARIL